MNELLTLTIFGSLAWATIILAALFAAFLTSEHVEHGGVAFLAVVCFLVINHYWGNINLMHLFNWQNILAYLGIGFVFAIVRIYFYGRKLKGYDTKSKLDSSLIRRHVKGNVFRWWFIWPASLIYWTFSSIIVDVWDFLYDRFESTFTFFLNLGIKSKNNGDKTNPA